MEHRAQECQTCKYIHGDCHLETNSLTFMLQRKRFTEAKDLSNFTQSFIKQNLDWNSVFLQKKKKSHNRGLLRLNYLPQITLLPKGSARILIWFREIPKILPLYELWSNRQFFKLFNETIWLINLTNIHSIILFT